MSYPIMDHTSNPESEFNDILHCKTTDTQSSKPMDFVEHWVNSTVESEILQGIKFRQEKPKYYNREHQYDNINYLDPCGGNWLYRKPSNQFYETSPTKSCSFYKRNTTSRPFRAANKNTSTPSSPRIKKTRKKCPMRIAELAIPSKRHCIETWRNKYDVLPGYMLDRLKQQVLDQRPIVHIPDAIICFKNRRTTTKRSRGCSANKDDQRQLHLSDLRYLCAIFGKKIARILNKPLDVTLNLQLQKIAKVVTKDLSEMLNSQRKNSKNNARNQKILSEMANKVTIWITTILEESTFKLLEEELRELEDEEGPVLDLIDDLVDNIVKTCEPSQSLTNSLEFYDSKFEATSVEDNSEKGLDTQYESSFLFPNITSNIDTPILGQMTTNTYDTEESISVHKSLIEMNQSQTVLSDASANDLSETEKTPNASEHDFNYYIKKEINKIIDNIEHEYLLVTLHTANDKELDEEFNNSSQNHAFDVKSQSKSDTDKFNNTLIEDTIHDNNKGNKNERSKDWKLMEPDSVENTLQVLELPTINGKDEQNNFNEYQSKANEETKDNHQFDPFYTQNNKQEYIKAKHVKDLNVTTPNIDQDSHIDVELEFKSDKDEHMNFKEFQTSDDLETKDQIPINHSETKDNKEEYIENSYVTTPIIMQDTINDIELETKSDKDEHTNFKKFQSSDNVEIKDQIPINNYEFKDKKVEHYKEEHVEDSYVTTPNIIQDTIKDVEFKIKSDKDEHISLNVYQAEDIVDTKDDNQLNNAGMLNDKKENASNIVQDQPLDIRRQTKSEEKEDIHFDELHITEKIENQNNNELDIEYIPDHNQDLEEGQKQLQDSDTDVQNEKLNVSEIFQIFSEEIADEKNKKVKFSNTNIVTHEAPMQSKTHSYIHLLEVIDTNDAEQELWKTTIENIVFAEANNNLLMNLDESWPADIPSPVLKASESVSRSITSLGKILETDEKLSSADPEDISIIDNPECIESGVKTLEDQRTEGSQNDNISIYSSLKIVGLDIKTSEPLITHELEIISKAHSDDRSESIKHVDNNISKILEDRVVDVLQLKEFNIIQDITPEKVIIKKSEYKRNIKINSKGKTKHSPKKLSLKNTIQIAIKSNKISIPKHKLETVVTGQDVDREGKINNKLFKEQEIVEEIHNIPGPTPEHKLDYKVYPETAPRWVTRARGEPCEDLLKREYKNKRMQEVMAFDMCHTLCRDLEQGFKNLEAWNNWIVNTSNSVKFLQQKRDFLNATKGRRRYLKYWIKLKKRIDQEATLWTKLYQRMQQRMKSYNNKDINKSKITSNKYCKMCMGKKQCK